MWRITWDARDGLEKALKCVWAGADIDTDAAGGVMLFDRGAVALDHHVGSEYGVIWADFLNIIIRSFTQDLLREKPPVLQD